MKTMTMIGNAHIDPVWLWQWREGFHEVKATFRSALDRMNENAEFVFTCACADYYKWVEENEPEMFSEIRARVGEGRWAIVGGMWIQPDMNAPSGESIARQLLYSQRYFHEKFGRTAKTGYNVDTFGHNGMLPQLLKRAGIDNYVWMRPGIHENPNIPEGAMIWRGIDGSEVYAYRIFGEYTTAHNMPDKIGKLFAFSDKIGMPVMCFYGVGNHGGGPTIENLREIGAYMNDDARGSEMKYGSPDSYFAELRESGAKLSTWTGELQHHASGCYSTHSISKKLHRECENALLRMETLGALSGALTGHKLKREFVAQAWDNLMFNEFHDIMGGCSLKASLKDTEIQFGEALSIAAREENAAVQRVSWNIDTSRGNPLRVRSKQDDWKLWGVNGQGTPIVVFNSHAYEAEGTVVIRRPIRAARDENGAVVPTQVVRAGRTNGENDRWDGIFRAKVPALGYKTYWVFLQGEDETENKLSATPATLENAKLRVEFDPATGMLTGLINKRSGKNALVAPARLRAMDIEASDTWAHNVFKFDTEAPTEYKTTLALAENGPVRAVIRATTRFGQSELRADYILYADADQLEVEARLDMREKFRMLKMCFPTDGGRDVSEIPYGALERCANGDEEHCQRWVAMQGEKSGFAVINDGKYSYSAIDGEIRMTVSNTSIFADHFGQGYRDECCEFMDQGEQYFKLALAPYEGEWRGAGLDRRADALNRQLTWVEETYHAGKLGESYSGIELDNPKAAVGAIKRAENDKGYVLRVAETTGANAGVNIDFKLTGRKLALTLGAFEVKTVYIPDDANLAPKEILITELDA